MPTPQRVAPPKATLRITMRQEFDTFGVSEREAFLGALSRVTGCPVEDMQRVMFRKGCVVAEVTMDEKAVQAFLELYERQKQAGPGAESSPVRALVEQYKVENASAEFVVSLVVRSGPAKKRQGLVFVHGWLGDATSFGRLPEYLGRIFDCEGAVYPYPTGWLTHSPSIYFVAQALDNWFRSKVSAERVAIVAHSMGGLVTRKFLVMQRDRKEPLDSRVRQVSLIASPHVGAALADLAEHIPVLRSAQIQELSASSGFVAELNAAWEHWLQHSVPGSCRVRSIFGTSDEVVAPANASGHDPEAIPILGASHVDIVKPESDASPIVETLARLIEEAGFKRAAPQAPPPSGPSSL